MSNPVLDALRDRRSIRRYKPELPPKEALQQIIDAGLYAASGHGLQTAIIVAVTDKTLRDRLSEMNRVIGGWDEGFDPFYGAPAVLIVLADKSSYNCVYDGALAMGNMMLAAHALGLGSCWINRARQEFDTRGVSRWGRARGEAAERRQSLLGGIRKTESLFGSPFFF